MSSLSDHYDEIAENRRRDFWRTYLARRSMEAAGDKIRSMCDAYRRHEAEYALPAMTEDDLYEVMRVALAGLEGRAPTLRIKIIHT